MAESSQPSGSQSVEASTGFAVPGDATVVEKTIKEGVPPEMKVINDVKDDVGLAQDGKPEGGQTRGGGLKEIEEHGECKLEKQENVLGMVDEKDKNEARKEDEGNAKEDAEVAKCKVKPQTREHATMGDKLESAEDLEDQNDVEHVEDIKNKLSEEIKRQERQVSQLEKLENVNKEAGEQRCEVKLEKLKDAKDDDDDLADSHCQGNGSTEERKKEGDIMTEVEEETKKRTKSVKFDETEDADNLLVKSGSKDGVDDEADKAGNVGKKYKRKKRSEKRNDQRGIDATRYARDVKGRKRKSEESIDEPDNTEQLEDIADKNKENGEHDVEATELEKLEEHDSKDEEDICQEDEMSDDEIKQGNDENVKVSEEAELEDDDPEDVEEAVDSDDEEKESKRKLSRGKRESGEKVSDGRKTLQEPTTPGVFADRPVRERKTVVRLVEVIEKEQGEGFRIEKGRGIPLKDLPNVVYKLSRRKPEDIKLLHLILFGRKGKASDFKSHISQFSGFAWPENEEKQKAKVKEKLDKCPGPKLLDFCDLFDIAVSRSTTKTEEIVEKLLNFLIAPYPTSDAKSSEKEQHSTVKRKRSSGGSFSDTIDSSGSKPLKKRRTGSSLKYSVDTIDKEEKIGEEDKGMRGNGLFTGNEDSIHSGSEKENDLIENVNTEDFDYSKKMKSKREKNKSVKKSPSVKKASPLSSGSEAKKSASKHTKVEETQYSGPKVSASRHKKAEETHDLGSKVSTSKHIKAQGTHDSGPKVFSRRKKVDTPKTQSPKPESRVKDIGRKLGRSKSDKPDKAEPNKDELRKMISVILKEVDFNTATFKDILKQLGTRFKTDLTHMKEEIKGMTKDELVKIAEEEANSDDDEEASDDEETAQPAAKKLRT